MSATVKRTVRLAGFLCAVGGYFGFDASAYGQSECRDHPVTDHFHFWATSARGAVGDIIPIDVWLTIDGTWPDLDPSWQTASTIFVLCFDGRELELVGEPAFTDVYDRLFWFSYGFRFPTSRLEHVRGEQGYVLYSFSNAVGRSALRTPGAAIPICTVFFRILGVSGTEAAVRFCDGELLRRDRDLPPRVDCNFLNCISAQRETRTLWAVSTRHVPATVRVVPGEPTQTELPELPPSAKVYPEAPTAETTRIHFEIPRAVARPGQRGVPVEVYVTSSHEFCGYSVALEFPRGLVSVSSVEAMPRQGVVIVENDLGRVCFAHLGGHRRIGQEGERVHLGTLRVDVSEEASGADEISFRFVETGKYVNWLRIRYAQDGVSMALPFTAEVQPLSLSARALRIQARPTALGDANLDYQVDISDAVGLLAYLFLGGEEPVCAAASDANRDGRVNAADPIAILNALFGGGGDLADTTAWCWEEG